MIKKKKKKGANGMVRVDAMKVSSNKLRASSLRKIP